MPDTTFDTRRPFTRADALAAGISPKMLRGSRFRRIFRDVYVAAASADRHERTRAALLIHPPTAFASHQSAARLYDLPVPPTSVEHVSVFAAADRRRREGIHLHVVGCGAEIRHVTGLRASAPTRMFVELATVLDLVDLVVVGDALVRRRLATVDDLLAAAHATSQPGVRLARRAASLVRAGVDSPMESRLRLLLILAGLPEPAIGHTIRDAQGEVLARFDLAYPRLRVAIEYDGRIHRDDLDQWDKDIARGEWLQQIGWSRITVVARDLFQRPEQTLVRVVTALKRLGHACRIEDGWRPHFVAA